MQTIRNKPLTIIAILLLESSVFTVMTNISTDAQLSAQLVSGPISSGTTVGVNAESELRE